MIEISLDLTNFNVLYKDKVYNNAIKCIPFVESEMHDRELIRKPEVTALDLFYLDESNRLCVLHDDNSEFQFVRK